MQPGITGAAVRRIMKLKEVQCDQFAGLNRNDPASTIKFGDGLNLIVGDNEHPLPHLY